MSKTRVNAGNEPNDFERFLRELPPAQLEVSRDELFFRAGYAAGAKTKGARLFWPSAAAALLIVCMGMGIAMQRQSTALNLALAQNPLPPGEGRVRVPEAVVNNQIADDSGKENPGDSESIVQHPHPGPLPQGEGGFSDARLRSWQQFATANFRQPGHLTARGWIESPEDVREPPSDGNDEPTTPRPSPSTYLELRQMHLEG